VSTKVLSSRRILWATTLRKRLGAYEDGHLGCGYGLRPTGGEVLDEEVSLSTPVDDTRVEANLYARGSLYLL
jgi:hypothetical protein